jgi:glycogen operon protein
MGLILDGRAQPTGIRRRGIDRTLLWIVNASHIMVEFSMPQVQGGGDWHLLLDTNQPTLEDEPEFAFEHVYGVTPRSLLLFELRHVPENPG